MSKQGCMHPFGEAPVLVLIHTVAELAAAADHTLPNILDCTTLPKLMSIARPSASAQYLASHLNSVFLQG